MDMNSEKIIDNKKDLIFVFFGGGMRGVFGAGVVSTLEKLNLYNRIHSVYSISSGAHDAAFFLAKGTQIGSSIYYEDLLIPDKFIKSNKTKFFFKFILNLLLNTKPEKLMDVDYLINIQKNRKVLNIENVLKSNIPFQIRLFNFDSKKEEWVDGKTNINEKLRAAAAAIPFYNDEVKINGSKYCDGDTLSKIIDPVLEEVINNNPNKKIFIIFNSPIKDLLSILSCFENILWTILLVFFIREKYFFHKLNFYREKRKLEKYIKFHNVIIIEPDLDISPFCTDKDKVIKLYKNGVDKTLEIMKEYIK